MRNARGFARMGWNAMKPHIGGTEDVFMAVVGDEMRDHINPGQNHYSRPTLVGGLTSAMRTLAKQRYTEPLRAAGVNAPDPHTEEQAELSMSATGDRDMLDDINWRIDRIKALSDSELKEYGDALKWGSKAERDGILEKHT